MGQAFAIQLLQPHRNRHQLQLHRALVRRTREPHAGMACASKEPAETRAVRPPKLTVKKHAIAKKRTNVFTKRKCLCQSHGTFAERATRKAGERKTQRAGFS